MTDKIAIVTGASSGIGFAVAVKLANLGARVYGVDIKPNSTFDSLAIQYIQADISKRNDIDAAVKSVAVAEGRVDYVVANAGIYVLAGLAETTETDLQRILDTNVKGTLWTLQSVLGVMAIQNSGSIVVIGSDQAVVGKRGSVAYAMSKAAVMSLSRCAALEYSGHGIRVNCVCPGAVDTPLCDRSIDEEVAQSGGTRAAIVEKMISKYPLGRIASPQDVANSVAFLLSDDAAFITGSVQMVDGGYTSQ